MAAVVGADEKVAGKKRGHPVGSKNKPKDKPEPKTQLIGDTVQL